jgi:hypothetical protein
MSKRKRASKPEPDESSDDATVKDDMVHVTPDLLAGSPDIFAGKKTQGATETNASEPALHESPAEPTEASTTLASSSTGDEGEASEPETPLNPSEASPIAVTAEPVATPPAYFGAAPAQAQPRRGGSSTAIGIVLIVIGIFALLVVMSGVDLSESGWPLFIIIPGLTLMVAGFLALGAVATIPGGIVTMLGVVLAYSNGTGHWAIWAYAWALVVPFGVGLGMYLQGLRDRDQPALHTGRTLLFVGLMIFLIGFVLFESILGVSGRDTFGPFGKAALPVLLILVGVILLVRSVQRSRQT